VSYHQFIDSDSDAEYGSFEVFQGGPGTDTAGLLTGPGWYWWACFPGCMPDGEPSGPFATEAEAIADAQGGAEWSGSLCPIDPDNYWIDDKTGERVNAVTGERTAPKGKDTRAELRARVKEYRENCPEYPRMTKTKRIPLEAA
jgi:hypothetical protein